MVIDELVGWMPDIRANSFTGSSTTVTLNGAVVIVLAGVATFLYGKDSLGNFGAGITSSTDASIIIRVDAVVDDFIEVLVGTVKDVVSEIAISADVNSTIWSTMMAVSEFITVTATLEELLLFS